MLKIRQICIVGFLTLLLMAAAPVSQPGADLAYDFLIANVCLDNAGRVLVGISPIDGDPRCVAQRNLQPGEALPYHIYEPASGNGPDGRIKGSDSFPVRSAQLGTLAVHIYDYTGYLPGQSFGDYSPVNRIGGGTLSDISGNTVSSIATQLGPQNLQLFVGAGCRPGQAAGAAALQDSWVLAPIDKLALLRIPAGEGIPGQVIAGGIVTQPSHMIDSARAVCPMHMPESTTRWMVAPVAYRAVYKAGPRRGQHVVLWTLIAEHFGSDPSHLNNAMSIERAYFTRELGWVRWEAWKNIRKGLNARLENANERVIDRNDCQLPNSASSNASFAMPAPPTDVNGQPRQDMAIAGCTETTTIAPPKNRNGDAPPTGPGTWYSSLLATPVGALFAPSRQ